MLKVGVYTTSIDVFVAVMSHEPRGEVLTLLNPAGDRPWVTSESMRRHMKTLVDLLVQQDPCSRSELTQVHFQPDLVDYELEFVFLMQAYAEQALWVSV